MVQNLRRIHTETLISLSLNPWTLNRVHYVVQRLVTSHVLDPLLLFLRPNAMEVSPPPCQPLPLHAHRQMALLHPSHVCKAAQLRRLHQFFLLLQLELHLICFSCTPLSPPHPHEPCPSPPSPQSLRSPQKPRSKHLWIPAPDFCTARWVWCCACPSALPFSSGLWPISSTP